MRRPAFVVLIAVALVLAGTSCAKSKGGTSAAGVHLVKAGALTVCTHLPYEPFQYKDDAGKIVGFDIDLMDLVAKKLKVRQSIVDTPFEGIKSGQDLNSGMCDVAAAGMTINPERQKVMDFSSPYFDANQALLVRSGSHYGSLESLRGKKLGTQAATTGEEYANAHAKAAGYTTVSYKDLAALQQALATRQVDAAIDDLPVMTTYVKHHPTGFTVSAQFSTGEQYGYSVKKGGNPKLLATINQVLAAAHKDGSYEKIYARWIGGKPGGAS
ncbi:ABC transporter substrate-binding protein [Actinocatenispora sera]|uniref:ABC transporter substrate-binding protein n=1 Tax=Actinocatenispora sera TaxID=390989 RepID=UPI0033E03BD9